MLITVGTVVVTHNLAIGVGVGVLAAMAMFARRVAHFATVERTEVELNGRTAATYTVDGELFFASSNDLYTQFNYARDAEPRHRQGGDRSARLAPVGCLHYRRAGRGHGEVPQARP